MENAVLHRVQIKDFAGWLQSVCLWMHRAQYIVSGSHRHMDLSVGFMVSREINRGNARIALFLSITCCTGDLRLVGIRLVPTN